MLCRLQCYISEVYCIITNIIWSHPIHHNVIYYKYDRPDQNLFNLLSKIGQFLLFQCSQKHWKVTQAYFVCLFFLCYLYYFQMSDLRHIGSTHWLWKYFWNTSLSGALGITARKGKEQNNTLEGYKTLYATTSCVIYI